MAKEGGTFDFSEQIEDINFTIDDTSKCYTIPNYNYWSSSTLINSSYGLNIDKLRKVIEEGKYNKLGVHGLTINWDNAQITVNDEDTSINTTPDLLKAIQDVGTTVGLNSNGKLRNSEFTNKYYDLINKINKLQDELNIEYSEPEIEDALVQFDGFDSFSGESRSMSVLVGDEITLPTSATKNSDSQYEYSFNGWKNNSTNTTYSPGSKVTINGDTTFTAQFTTIPREYLVTFRITNGKIIDGDGISSTQNVAQTFVDYGQTTTWTIEPDEGYKLPTSVTNGRIDGNEVTCNIVNGVFECTADCVEEDTSYTYIGDDSTQNWIYNENIGIITVNDNILGSNTFTNYPIDTNLVLQAWPNGNYKFAGWDIDGTTVYDNPHTFIVSNNYHNITANFIDNI